MMNICKYSILIYAGNVTILLIVAISTDYWEYRGFDTDAVNRSLSETRGIRVIRPLDTDSYIIVNYRKQPKPPKSRFGHLSRERYPSNDWMSRIIPYGSSHIGTSFYKGNESDDEPTLFVRRYFHIYGEAEQNKVDGSMAYNLRQHDTREYNYPNTWGEQEHEQNETEEMILVLYWQYGNLFRDCDNLEAHVRRRLAMANPNRHQCYSFFMGERHGTVLHHIPNVFYLEMTSFACAILSVGSMTASLVFGGIGSFEKSKRALLYASTSSLLAGFLLIISIALFNGKSHLLRRRQITVTSQKQYDVIMTALNTHRQYWHGWSFVLAWICVALCFVSSYVWLYKGESIGYGGVSSRNVKTYLRRWKTAKKYIENYND